MSDQNKIVFITAHLGEPHGSAKSARDFARALLQSADNVHIVSPKKESFNLDSNEKYLITNPKWHNYRISRRRNIVFRLFNSFNNVVKKIIIRIHTNESYVLVNGWASYNYWKSIGVNNQKQLIIIIRESPRHFKFKDRETTLSDLTSGFSEFDSLIFVSNLLRQEWTQFKNLKNKQTYYLPNCCEEEEIQEIKKTSKIDLRTKLNLPKNNKIVIYPGTIEERKGQDMLLNSWREIYASYPRIKLIILGNGATKRGKEILKKIQDKEYGDGIIHIPAKPSAIPYLYASDILIFPSRAEAMPRTILEAMAIGMPIIASNIDGVPELIDDGENGYLFPLDDHKNMILKLKKVIGDNDVSESLALNAKEKYYNSFSREVYKRNVNRILMKITNEKD